MAWTPEKWREYHRAYRAKNKERIREQTRLAGQRFREKHGDKWREMHAKYQREWRAKNPEAANAIAARYRAKHPHRRPVEAWVDGVLAYVKRNESRERDA